MNILLFGKVGQLGWEARRALAPLGNIISLDYPEINLADAEGTRQAIRSAHPQVIVNAAAYTAVDQAESEQELAFSINDAAVRIMSEEALEAKAALIHFSTDYVFDGAAGRPYRETDIPNPLSVYGKSKLAGEQSIQQVGGAYVILRTSWVYSTRQGGFVNKVLQWSRQQKIMRVVTDQVASPTWCRMLAETTAQLLAMAYPDPYAWISERKGLYHLAGSGSASRWEWARAILDLDPAKQEQVVEEIQPALTSEFPAPAARPLFSALDCKLFSDVFSVCLPYWEDALKLAMDVG